MRKVFPLDIEGLKPPRVIDSIKNDIRKYLKRERKKELPEGADFWDFDCQVGPNRENPKATHVKELNGSIDTAARERWEAIYIEILAKPGNRSPKDPGSASDA